MSYGLRVWTPDGQLRLDTNHRTMRLTDRIYIPGRSIPGGMRTENEFIALDGFVFGVDGAFLVSSDNGKLAYDGGSAAGYMPHLALADGGATLTWRGNEKTYHVNVVYMPVYLMVLRST